MSEHLRLQLEGVLTSLDDLRIDIEAWASRFVRQLPDDLAMPDGKIDRFRPWEVVTGEMTKLDTIVHALKHIVDYELNAPPPPVAPLHRMHPTAAEICVGAAELVGGLRAVTHGDKALNFKNIADIWTAVLTAKSRRDGTVEIFVDPLDVANMLEALKIARRYSGDHNIDDYVDGAGYAGCAGEIAEHLNIQPKET
jgi:hypothetical protein